MFATKDYMICLFDLETSSKEPLQAEIITGYFEVIDGDEVVSSYHFKSQIDNWSDEAADIHKISRVEMLSYPEKKKALYMLNNYLKAIPADTEFWLYANPSQMGECVHYDKAVIEMQLMMNDLDFKFPNINSVYTLAKTAYAKQLFDPIKLESKTGRMINSFKQEMIYEALFDSGYNAHNAVSDTMAMKKIYYELTDMLANNRASKFKKQITMDI